MSLLEMSFAGGVLILAIIVLRALTLNRLPKGTFLTLWGVAVLRLLVPFSIPSPASVYTLAETVQVRTAAPAAPVPAADPVAAPGPVLPSFVPAGTTAAVPESGAAVDIWLLAWLAGAAVCGAVFLISYLRCRREFRMALPVEDKQAQAWLAGQSLRRTVSLRQLDRVDAPLTYGLLHPVILLPKGWENERCLDYVLEHELTHIRHLDALWKLALVFTACVHWFNPLAWCMLVLANRDMELLCDEAVVRRMGLDRRSSYALALISLEEKKSSLGPFASAFNKNAIEERIRAIMKIKKRSLAAILAAVVLVCCVGVAFATSAAQKTPYPNVEDGSFTKEELDRLASLWFKGYEDMTVAEYQQKMWAGFDTPEDHAVIERYAQAEPSGSDFADYFFNAYLPLTGDNWSKRSYDASSETSLGLLEYSYTITIPDPTLLTVGEYLGLKPLVNASVQVQLKNGLAEKVDIAEIIEAANAQIQRLETHQANVTIAGNYAYIPYDSPDAALHAQSSQESAKEWDRVLSPYAPFGLTWKFDDPDLDGNGLTMWFQGKEVRSISDEQEHLWITEHTGDSFPDGAVDLYVVYTDGVLSGLREATPEEQAAFDEDRQRNTAERDHEEQREFPRATLEDYDSILSLRTVEVTDLPEWASYPYPDARDLPLEDLNQRLLDWANANPDAWDRINCDVLWNDFDRELTTDARTFVSVTCNLSGIENGQMVRALYTGNPEEDPRLSHTMPMRSNEENGIVNAWCDLYYDISYHIADKSKVTARERDACVGGMLNAINTFWQDTDFDTLLGMSEADVVAEFNRLAAEVSTEDVKINPITADNIHFEHNDERGID